MRKLAFLAAFAVFCRAQDTVPVHMLVTVEAQHGSSVPSITQHDVLVSMGKERLPVTDWTPLQGDRAGLQLLLLIDDNANSEIGVQFNDIKSFIASLPATTEIGIEYMRNGTTQVAQALTADHAAAAKHLRLPMGPSSGAGSPYMSLQDVIKKWPATTVRREVLMISSGIDAYYPVGPDNPYLESAISDAQKGGIIVHSIYYGVGGHLGHSFARVNWGQNYLSMLGDQTGGEAYWQGFINPVSLQPYLKDLSGRLDHQYLLTFLAKPGKKSELLPIKLHTEVHGAELVSADRAYVPGDR